MTSQTPLISLSNQKYISLTTFRRTGEAIATPVWFVQLQDTLYIFTPAGTGKVKRVRNNPQVQFAICTMSGKVKGSSNSGVARIVTDPQEEARVKAALDAKYWIARRLLGLLNGAIRLFRGNRSATPVVYLAINRD